MDKNPGADEAPTSGDVPFELPTLTEDEQVSLSKVLFPDTHVEEVILLDLPRKIKPIPVKFSRQIFALLKPISEKIGKSVQEQDKQEFDSTDEITKSLFQVANILADFYKWEDVKQAAAQELLSLSEVQTLAYAQQEVNGSNDFLLGPLRLIIRVQQVHETLAARFQSLLTGQLFAKPLPAALNS